MMGIDELILLLICGLFIIVFIVLYISIRQWHECSQRIDIVDKKNS